MAQQTVQSVTDFVWYAVTNLPNNPSDTSKFASERVSVANFPLKSAGCQKRSTEKLEMGDIKSAGAGKFIGNLLGRVVTNPFARGTARSLASPAVGAGVDLGLQNMGRLDQPIQNATGFDPHMRAVSDPYREHMPWAFATMGGMHGGITGANRVGTHIGATGNSALTRGAGHTLSALTGPTAQGLATVAGVPVAMYGSHQTGLQQGANQIVDVLRNGGHPEGVSRGNAGGWRGGSGVNGAPVDVKRMGGDGLGDLGTPEAQDIPGAGLTSSTSKTDAAAANSGLMGHFNKLPGWGKALGVGAGALGAGLLANHLTGEETDEETGEKKKRMPWLGPLVGAGALGAGAHYMSGGNYRSLLEPKFWGMGKSGSVPMVLMPYLTKFADGVDPIKPISAGTPSITAPTPTTSPVPPPITPPNQLQTPLSPTPPNPLGSTAGPPSTPPAPTQGTPMHPAPPAPSAAGSINTTTPLTSTVNGLGSQAQKMFAGLSASGNQGSAVNAARPNQPNLTPSAAPTPPTPNGPTSMGPMQAASMIGGASAGGASGVGAIATRAAQQNPEVMNPDTQRTNIARDLQRQGMPEGPGMWERVQKIWEGLPTEMRWLVGAGLGLGALGLLGTMTGSSSFGGTTGLLMGLGGLGAAAYGAGAFNPNSALRTNLAAAFSPTPSNTTGDVQGGGAQPMTSIQPAGPPITDINQVYTDPGLRNYVTRGANGQPEVTAANLVSLRPVLNDPQQREAFFGQLARLPEPIRNQMRDSAVRTLTGYGMTNEAQQITTGFTQLAQRLGQGGAPGQPNPNQPAGNAAGQTNPPQPANAQEFAAALMNPRVTPQQRDSMLNGLHPEHREELSGMGVHTFPEQTLEPNTPLTDAQANTEAQRRIWGQHALPAATGFQGATQRPGLPQLNPAHVTQQLRGLTTQQLREYLQETVQGPPGQYHQQLVQLLQQEMRARNQR
jgi:hypothetical protein